MRTLLNILWHFPFLGFLSSLVYAIFGALMCCTIIFIPIGLGWLQFAKFLLAPFSFAMISRSDYEMITGEKHNEAYGMFSIIIRVLYFPFGCLAAVAAVFIIAAEFLSVVGIPCGIVCAKSFNTIFNPIGKVCVPKAVADEIERMKSAELVGKYMDRNSNVQANSDSISLNAKMLADEERVQKGGRPKVRQLDDERLSEIIGNAEMYNAELVEQCRHEMEIRRKSEDLCEKVAGFGEDKLHEILADTGLYSDELVYCCQKEYDRRAEKHPKDLESVQK